MKPRPNTIQFLLPTASPGEIELVYRELLGVIGEEEKSKHVGRFQCPNYGNGCYEWAERWKMNSDAPYCSTDGRKMKYIEFDEQDGDDWVRNGLREEQRQKLDKFFGKEG